MYNLRGFHRERLRHAGVQEAGDLPAVMWGEDVRGASGAGMSTEDKTPSAEDSPR
jgi:hypothetical protein